MNPEYFELQEAGAFQNPEIFEIYSIPAEYY
jgi:hypothetical protein